MVQVSKLLGFGLAKLLADVSTLQHSPGLQQNMIHMCFPYAGRIAGTAHCLSQTCGTPVSPAVCSAEDRRKEGVPAGLDTLHLFDGCQLP
jgi:hypothetical protein